MQLSLGDQRLVEELYRIGALRRANLFGITKPHRAFILTDSQCPRPQISHDCVSMPACTIALPGGGLLLDEDLEQDTCFSQFILKQVLDLHKRERIDSVALVVRVPSAGVERYELSFVEVIDHLLRSKHSISERIHHLRIVDFISLRFPDKREYLYSVEPNVFARWYDEYERKVLERQEDLDDLPADEPIHFIEA